MRHEWKECLLGDIITFQRGYDLPRTEMIYGQYPVVGSNGIIGYHNKHTTEAPSITIGRSGNVGNPYIFNGKSWSHNTTLYIKEFRESDPYYVYYLLKTLDLGNFAGGSAVPTLNRNHIHTLPVIIPSLSEQIEIGKTLKILDNKIDLNNRMNKTLEEMAQAIFKSWFVDFEPWSGVMPEDWREGVLGNYVEIKRGGSPRPIQDYLSGTGLRWLKISDVTSLQTPFVLDIKEHIKESGLKKTVFLKSGSLVLSNSATPGIPKIIDVDTCIHDGWLYFPKSYFSNEYLYLFFKHIRQDLVALGNGSVFTNLKTDILKNFPAIIPDSDTLQQFYDLVVPLFENMKNCTNESAHLAAIRDALLPKLMSGEISSENP